MKKIPLVLTILATTGAAIFALSLAARDRSRQLATGQLAWRTQTQELADIQLEQETLAAKVHALEYDSQTTPASATFDPALVDLLLTNGAASASVAMQEKLLAAFGSGENSSDRYVLVSKAALKTMALRPLKRFPNHAKLTDAARGVLALTPGEQQAVEAAFGATFAASAAWAAANLRRDGPSGDMLVRYTIPADPPVEQASTENLFTQISGALGDERADLLRGFFQYSRIYEDGAVAQRTNIFEIHRIAAPPGLGYRAGFKTRDGEEAINTDPEPIQASRFPAPFRLVFPGGWQEVAEKEGIELPAGFGGNP